MKRLLFLFCITFAVIAAKANKTEVIYQGPKQIGDWGTVELSSVKFHDLEMGDTIYVYASKVGENSKGAFQDHEWHALPGVMNGGPITGDFELVIDDAEVLKLIKQHGLKVRGENYEIEKIVIKHNDHLVRNILIGASILIFLALLLALGILIYKNHQLRKVNQGLYMRNLDVIAASDHERRIRAHYEGQIEAFKEMLKNHLTGNRQKYQNSTLDDDDKTMLTNRILKVFEDTEEIFALDFNMQKLATLVNSNYNNVSQVVNEQFGKNFSQLLNEYRIKEACRRLNNLEKYGNMTIESIGNDLGYGSRSTFITQFKALTSLTPSEFQNLARQQSKA